MARETLDVVLDAFDTDIGALDEAEREGVAAAVQRLVVERARAVRGATPAGPVWPRPCSVWWSNGLGRCGAQRRRVPCGRGRAASGGRTGSGGAGRNAGGSRVAAAVQRLVVELSERLSR